VATTPLSTNKFRFYFTVSWLVWSMLHVGVLVRLGYPLKTALLDSLVSNLLLAAAAMLVINNLRYYLPRKEQFAYLLLMCLSVSGLWLLLSRWAMMLVYRIEDYSNYSASIPIRFGGALLIIGCVMLVSVLWYTLDEQKETERRKNESERLAKDAELYKLRQQLQPHFLFNSLNSINALIGSRPEEARKMVQYLSDFLRGTIKKEENQFITLAEEMEYLNLYLEIEKVRFGYRLVTEIDNSEESLQCKIPSLMLQPIMENAIKFGLYGTTGEVKIGMRARVVDNYLVVAVMNPYDPNTQMQEGTGFGLKSVKRRLYLLYGRNDLVEINITKDSFVVVFKIPDAHA
jgi:two-component system LytT family sensor kinase